MVLREWWLDGIVKVVIGTAQWVAARVSPVLAKRYPVRRMADLEVPSPEGHSIPVDLYIPTAARPEKGWPLAYVIHGGGFRFFSKDSHAVIGARIAAQGYLALVVDYRLAPAHPFPAALQDVFAVYDWAHGHIAEFGGTMENCVISGESAGGNLTLCLTLAALGFEEYAKWKTAHGSWRVPEKIIVNCGALRLLAEERIRSGRHSAVVGQRFRRIQRDYLPQSLDGTPPGEWDMAEPLTIVERHVASGGRLTDGFPQTLIPVGGEDPVLEDSRRLGRVLEVGGARGDLRIYAGSTHGFYVMPWDRNAAICWKDLESFLRR